MKDFFNTPTSLSHEFDENRKYSSTVRLNPILVFQIGDFEVKSVSNSVHGCKVKGSNVLQEKS